jgi:serine/threonine-protein kinase
VIVALDEMATRVTPDFERQQLSLELEGSYQIVRELGRGAMGIVYLARDVVLHRLVAIKVLRHEVAATPEGRERFRREARLMARLGHPGIVPVHAFHESGDLLYIVMKYVFAESLADRLRRTGRLSPAESCRVLAELALALDYAHREGVVHRDLKAENILLERETGRPMLTDFGVATLRSADVVPAEARRAFGTPHYMSPEQASGELDIDGRSDIYALGVLGYMMLSGRMPFDGATSGEIVAKHIVEPPPPLATVAPHVPPAVAAVIERCLRKERSERWRHARDLHAALVRAPSRRSFFGKIAAML